MTKKRTGCSVAIGITWLLSGMVMLPYGLNFVLTYLEEEYIAGPSQKVSIVDNIAPFVGGVEYGVIILIAFCILFGRILSRFVFEKKVHADVAYITTDATFLDIMATFFKIVIVLVIFSSVGYFGKPWFASDFLAAVEMLAGATALSIAFSYFRNTMVVKSVFSIYDKGNF